MIDPKKMTIQEEKDHKGKPTGNYKLTWTEYKLHSVGYYYPDKKTRIIPNEAIHFIVNQFKDSIILD